MVWFPTSKSRLYQNEDFGLVGAVADLIEAGRGVLRSPAVRGKRVGAKGGTAAAWTLPPDPRSGRERGKG